MSYVRVDLIKPAKPMEVAAHIKCVEAMRAHEAKKEEREKQKRLNESRVTANEYIRRLNDLMTKGDKIYPFELEFISFDDDAVKLTMGVFDEEYDTKLYSWIEERDCDQWHKITITGPKSK